MLKKISVKNITLVAVVFAMMSSPLFAQFDIGADVVSRYVWRGWDFGNSAAVQPALTYGNELAGGALEIGAWGSFALTSGAANENDLYVSYSTGPVTVVVTDYYFPGYTGADKFGNYGENGGHILEAGAGFSAGIFSLMGFYNFSGFDSENSAYVELGVTPPYEVEGIELGLFVGAGNGVYDFVAAGESPEFVLTNVGLSVSKDNYSASYIVNPDQETSFLVFGISL